jgi:hypothetical protein
MRLRTLSEAECYARCYERLRELFEERLDHRGLENEAA